MLAATAVGVSGFVVKAPATGALPGRSWQEGGSAVSTLALLWKTKKVPEPIIVLGAVVIGLLVYPLIHP